MNGIRRGINNWHLRFAHIVVLSTIPEEWQGEIQKYLLLNFCDNNPYSPLSEADILSELAEYRRCYAVGEGVDFDQAIDEISLKIIDFL